MAHRTTWNGSAHRTASGQRSATTAAIQSAPSAETWVIAAQRPSRPPDRRPPRRRRTGAGSLCRGPVRPTPAGRCRGRRPRSGTCGRACRRSRRSRSGAARRTGRSGFAVSAQTRVMIAPTVRQAIRISSVTAVFEHWVASHATCCVEGVGVAGGVPRPRHRRAPSARGRGSSPAARRPPARPGPCPGPRPATDADPRPGHSQGERRRTDRTDPRHAGSGRTCATSTPSPRPRRTRGLRRPSSRPPTGRAIGWRLARRSPLFGSWSLTAQKPRQGTACSVLRRAQPPTEESEEP